MAPVRDPLLGAAQSPAVAVRHRPGAERAGIGPRARLRECERAEHPSRRELRHEPPSLLLGAEREDRERRGARVHGHGDADARVGARQLFEHEDVRDEIRARSAELLRHAHAEQAELAQLREQRPRERVVAVPRGRVRHDLRVGHVAGECLDRALLRRRGEVHRVASIVVAHAPVTRVFPAARAPVAAAAGATSPTRQDHTVAPAAVRRGGLADGVDGYQLRRRRYDGPKRRRAVRRMPSAESRRRSRRGLSSAHRTADAAGPRVA